METLPGAIVRRTAIDIAGDQTALSVNGFGRNPATGVYEGDQAWLGWSTTSNAESQITRE